MEKLIASTLLACLFVGSATANSPPAPSEDPTDIAAVKQVSTDMGDAMVAADVDRLNQIFADDWVAISMTGKSVTKDTALNNVKSGKDKLDSFELGPIDVQVFGNVATAHGSVWEKRSWDGKDSTGTFVWMDILEKRVGKWVVVRSAGDRVI
jgi:ketosteroid isomerase-like protein